MRYNLIRLQLHSNLIRYKVSISSRNEYFSQVIYGQCSTLCLKIKSKNVLVILSPLDENYYDKLFVKLDTSCCEHTINHNFLKRSLAKKTYYFSLYDANYGLKIDGVLNFKSI